MKSQPMWFQVPDILGHIHKMTKFFQTPYNTEAIPKCFSPTTGFMIKEGVRVHREQSLEQIEYFENLNLNLLTNPTYWGRKYWAKRDVLKLAQEMS